MTQTSNRFYDEIGRLMNDAAGAAQGVKREVDAVMRNQAERILHDLDLVKREEFEAVKDMARLAREENEALKSRIAALEAKLGVAPSAPDNGGLKTRMGQSVIAGALSRPSSFPRRFWPSLRGAPATKQSTVSLPSHGLLRGSLSSGGAVAPTRWLAMTVFG